MGNRQVAVINTKPLKIAQESLAVPAIIEPSNADFFRNKFEDLMNRKTLSKYHKETINTLVRKYMPDNIFKNKYTFYDDVGVKTQDYLFSILSIYYMHDLLLEYVKSPYFDTDENLLLDKNNCNILIHALHYKKIALIDATLERCGIDSKADTQNYDSLKLAIKNSMTDVVRKIVIAMLDTNIFTVGKYEYTVISEKQQQTKHNDYLFSALLDFKLFNVLEQYIESEYYIPQDAPFINNSATYLIEALAYKQEKLAHFLLDKGGCKLDHLNHFNDSALTYACYSNLPSVASRILLMQDDCKAEIINKENKCALDYAIYYNMTDVLKILFRKLMPHMNVFMNRFYEFNNNNIKSNTKLFFCLADLGMHDLLEEYVQSKYYQNQQNIVSGQDETYLIYALKKKYTKLATNILTAGQCHLNHVDIFGKTAIMYAIDNKYTEIVLLIDLSELKENNINLMFSYIIDNCFQPDIVDKIINNIKNSYIQLKISESRYRYITQNMLELFSRVGALNYIQKLFDNFSYHQDYILAHYKKSLKEVRKIIMDNFDINDVAFMLEKYGSNILLKTNY